MVKKIKANPIIFILIIFAIIKICSIIDLGVEYNLKSDDLSYIHSGIEFLETGKIIMHGQESAQILPGMTFLIAFLASFCGKGFSLWLILKIVWLLMGLATIFGVYKIVELFLDKKYAWLPCLFFLAPDFIWMDNLILTETPYMLALVYFIYNTLVLIIRKNQGKYKHIVFWFLFGFLFRPTFLVLPVFLILYLILNKYDYKLMLKQILIALGCLLVFVVPWTIRNYRLFDEFIPVSYGVGNPLLLGTYQGYGYPLDEDLNYKPLEDKIAQEKKLLKEKLVKNEHLDKYFSLKLDEEKAKYRMKTWWKTNPKSMLVSYFIIKPRIMIYNQFYWSEVFNMPKTINLIFRAIDIIFFSMSIIYLVYRKKYLKELLFLLTIYGYHIATYSYTFSFSRYAQTLYFLRHIIIGLAISELLKIRQHNRNN